MDCHPEDRLRADVAALLSDDPARRMNRDEEVDRLIQLVTVTLPARAAIAGEFPG
jgi:hypothetical protein